MFHDGELSGTNDDDESRIGCDFGLPLLTGCGAHGEGSLQC